VLHQGAEKIPTGYSCRAFRNHPQHLHGAAAIGDIAHYGQELRERSGRVSDRADHHIPPLGNAGLRGVKSSEAPYGSAPGRFDSLDRQRNIFLSPKIDPGRTV
jgi:hypothetical protein